MRWIEKLTGGSRNDVTASGTQSIRTYIYTRQEIGTWFGSPGGTQHRAAPAADFHRATMRQHVRLADEPQAADPTPLPAVRRSPGSLR